MNRSPWLTGLVLIIIAAATGSADAQTNCQSSWVFSRSTYTHDPATGARVAQYDRPVPVEPLPDPRLVTSGYRRNRTNLIGTRGAIEQTYEVQSWGNGRGGIDAEWERFHDAWLQSSLSGGYYGSGGASPYGFAPPGPVGPYPQPVPPYVQPGYGNPGYGYPGYGFPGYGGPGNGGWQSPYPHPPVPHAEGLE